MLLCGEQEDSALRAGGGGDGLAEPTGSESFPAGSLLSDRCTSPVKNQVWPAGSGKNAEDETTSNPYQLNASIESRGSLDAESQERREKSIRDFSLIRVIGKGSYGKVMLVKETNRPKVIPFQDDRWTVPTEIIACTKINIDSGRLR